MLAVTAVFDIGKTNKKLLLFDNSGKVVYLKEKIMPETTDEDGDPCDDLDLIKKWVLDNWNEIIQNKELKIRAVNFTSYGASFVHLDIHGNPVTPLYNYLKEFPRDLLEQFYSSYGPETDFAVCTSSPSMGMLNSGLQLYWLKHRKKELFNNIHVSLHLPQYLSFLLSGAKISDYTSIGCHTALWDFTSQNYHEWVKKETIDHLLPPIYVRPVVAFKRLGKRLVNIGAGLHDSSASLIPYLKTYKDPFLLLSTGTWCIALNPFDRSVLTAEELKNDCLHFLTTKGTRVKAARIFLGKEHDYQVERITAHFHKETEYHKKISFNKELMTQLIKTSALVNYTPRFISSTLNYSERSMKDWDLSGFQSFEEAYHQLNLDLSCLLKATVALADSNQSKTIFVDGGFSKSTIFMNLLANHFPQKEIIASDMAHATALGAFMHLHNKNKEVPQTLTRYKESSLHNDLKIYMEKNYSGVPSKITT